MHQITITRVFCASHALRLPDGSLEPVHGHNWEVSVTVGATKLDAMDCVMDFHDLEQWLDETIAGWRNRHLNDVEPFGDRHGGLKINPSAERVAEVVGKAIGERLPRRVKLVSTRVTEAPGCAAMWVV